MSSADALPLWVALLVSFFLVLGGGMIFTGGLGLLRLDTFYRRIHAPAIAITLGAGCLLIASMIFFTVSGQRLVIHELLISAFILMTAPVVSMMILRTAVYRERREKAAAAATAPGTEA